MYLMAEVKNDFRVGTSQCSTIVGIPRLFSVLSNEQLLEKRKNRESHFLDYLLSTIEPRQCSGPAVQMVFVQNNMFQAQRPFQETEVCVPLIKNPMQFYKQYQSVNVWRCCIVQGEFVWERGQQKQRDEQEQEVCYCFLQ